MIAPSRPAPTYETASTRAFYHARTDTVRSCTVEAYNWCQAMVNPGTQVGRRDVMHLAPKTINET